MKPFSITMAATLTGLIILGTPTNQAIGAGSRGGKIILISQKPSSTLSVKDARKFARKHKIESVKQNDKQEWAFYTLTLLKRPLNDFDLKMLVYDVSRGTSKAKRRLLKSIYHHTLNSDSKSISGKVKLKRPEFDANRTYQLIAESRGKELAKVLFSTKGVSTVQMKQTKHLQDVKKELAESNAKLKQRLKEEQRQAEKTTGTLSN